MGSNPIVVTNLLWRLIYDTAKRNIIEEYSRYCLEKQLPFEVVSSIKSYDDTTLFCPAGMQKYKNLFRDTTYSNQTISNIQSCLRLNDLDSLGDGIHLGCFNMIGIFSFRHWSVQQMIDFWLEFLIKKLELKIDYVTIHPDKPEWKQFYNLETKYDENCKWSDGEIGGYCTEFYVNNIEIGNIVNPLGTCLDVGFGLERLDFVLNGTEPKSSEELLKETILKIIECGYKPSNTKQGYVLRRLIRLFYKKGFMMDHPFFLNEVERQERMYERYQKLLPKYLDKSKEWWYETHGVEIDS